MIVYIIIVLAVLLAISMGFSRLRESRLRSQGVLPARGEETMDDVRRLVAEDRKVLAIRVYRLIHGVGLAEAKAAVEALDAETADDRSQRS